MGNLLTPDGLAAAKQYFEDALLKYGRSRLQACNQSAAAAGQPDRNSIKYVGQFIDREGISSKQNGVYGMSAWLTLTEPNSTAVGALRTACLDGLAQWIKQTEPDDIANHPTLEAYELRTTEDLFRISRNDGRPKRTVCTRFIGIHPECRLRGRSFLGALTNSNQGEAWMSALVVRTFRSDPDFASLLPKALTYLYRQFTSPPNPCLRLYVLNTIYIADPHCNRLSNVKPKRLRRLIRKQIRALLQAIRRDPLSLANPIT